MSQDAALRIAAARATLEGFRSLTFREDPYELASARWIDELHETVQVIAAPQVQACYRLDGLSGVTMRFLYQRVREVLHDFDQLVAENPRLQTQG